MTLAKKIIITVLSLFLFLILTIVSGVIFFEFKYKNSFYPGVSIAGESVAGKKYDDVLQYFKEKSDRIQKFGLDVYIDGINGQNKINIPISYNGLTSDRVVEYFSLGNIEDVIKKFKNERNVFYKKINLEVKI
jgi:hypothetical protein